MGALALYAVSTKTVAVVGLTIVSLAALAYFFGKHIGKKHGGKGKGMGGMMPQHYARAVPGRRFLGLPATTAGDVTTTTTGDTRVTPTGSINVSGDHNTIKQNLITVMSDNSMDQNQFHGNMDRIVHDIDGDLSHGGRLDNLIRDAREGRIHSVDFDDRIKEYMKNIALVHHIPFRSPTFVRFGSFSNVLLGSGHVGGSILIGGSSDRCQDKYHGSCNKECKHGASSECIKCQIACSGGHGGFGGHGGGFGFGHGGFDIVGIRQRIKLLIKMHRFGLRTLHDDDITVIQRWAAYSPDIRVDPDIAWLLGPGRHAQPFLGGGGMGGGMGGRLPYYGYQQGVTGGYNRYAPGLMPSQQGLQMRYEQFNNPFAPYSGSDNPYNNRYLSPYDIQSHYYFGS